MKEEEKRIEKMKTKIKMEKKKEKNTISWRVSGPRMMIHHFTDKGVKQR